MLGRSLALLLLALLSYTNESAAHTIHEHDHVDQQLVYGHVVPADFGMHLALSNITRREQLSGPSSGYWSHVSAVRQRRLLRIQPSPPDEPVRLVYALCPHDHEQRLLQGAPFIGDQSQIAVFLHRSRRGESLDALQKRVEDGERIYDDNWFPIYPEQLTDWEEDGSGAWEGELPHGGMLEIRVSDSWIEAEEDEDVPIDQHWADYSVDSHVRFEVERLQPRAQRPFNETDPLGLPLLGSTTGTQAIIFSPPFSKAATRTEQGLSTYPNYSLPLVDPPPSVLQQPQPPAFRLILRGTNQRTTAKRSLIMEGSGSCAARRLAARQQGGPTFTPPGPDVNATASVVLRSIEGWRVQWVVEGLVPGVNYTASVVTPNGETSGIFVLTKSADFPCQLVHSLPYCPRVSYAVPLAALPAGGATTYSTDNLPSTLTEPLLDTLRKFSTALGSFSCGNDWWSPIHSCSSCFEAYRSWACGIWFPQCGEPTNDAPAPTTPLQASVTRPAALRNVPAGGLPRSPARDLLATMDRDYATLLPCLETCQAVERACPPFIGFKCPRVSVNANQSYGVGYVDHIASGRGGSSFVLPKEEQKRLANLTRAEARGVEADVYGNRWCAGDVVLDYLGMLY